MTGTAQNPTFGGTPTLTELADAARVLRDAMKDRSYRATPLGLVVGRYYRWKKFEWGATEATLRDYEIPLAYLSLDHADLELRDFEPPVGTERLREFLEARWGEREPRTRAKNLSILRDFFRWAQLEGLIQGDPTLPIRRPRKRGVVRSVFTPGDVAKVLAAQPRMRDRVALMLLFYVGIRKAELLGVQYKHFDHATHLLTIVKGKGGKVRRVPILHPELMGALERLILDAQAEPDDYLLNTRARAVGERGVAEWVEDPSRPLSPVAAHRWWAGCLERAGLPHRPMHEARHTAISAFLRSPHGSMELAQLLAGHASVSTTVDIYGHMQTTDLEDALRRLYHDEDA